MKLGFVDLSARIWHLLETKNQREHTVHLSYFAGTQFGSLLELREVSALTDKVQPWVFPNVAGTGPVNVKSFGKQLADRQRPPDLRLKNRSKETCGLVLPGGRWTPHDLRRSAATLMVELGVIDECLNHIIDSWVRRVYVRNRRLSDQAKAFDALGECLNRLVLDAMLTLRQGDQPFPNLLRPALPEVLVVGTDVARLANSLRASLRSSSNCCSRAGEASKPNRW